MVNVNRIIGKSMKFYDISIPISHNMTVYTGDPRVGVRPAAQTNKGHPFNTLLLSMSSHTGTHVDAPYHFDENGTTVDQIPLEIFCGPAIVREITNEESIDENSLATMDIPPGTQRLLLKTNNSRLWGEQQFQPRYVSVTPDGARWIVERGLLLIGIDYLSIEAFGSTDFPTHHTLLRAGIIIVEGLDLKEISPGDYTFLCFPLRLAKGDGAPARAVLIQSTK